MGMQPAISIKQAMDNINHYYFLPAFQREFVWNPEQIEKLFDSIMQEYPMNTMLFWKVSGNAASSWKYYEFLNKYIKDARGNNNVNNLKVGASQDFYAILDGQQRLTALRIGLYGTYAIHEKNFSWDYSAKNFPDRTLYIRLSLNTDEKLDCKYLFLFKKDSETERKDLYTANDGSFWFRVGKIMDLPNPNALIKYKITNSLTDEQSEIIGQLLTVIFYNSNIIYYEETNPDPDVAVTIFTRINSGGTNLDMTDIAYSLLVANWSKIDARNQITGLKTTIAGLGFDLTKEFLIKAILYLYSKSIKTEIKCFTDNFCLLVEDNWDRIRDCIIEVFKLIKTFGINSTTLTSYNSILPIIYYLLHKNIYNGFSTAKAYDSERESMKKWLLTILVKRVFGSHTDGILSKSRSAFTEDIAISYIDSAITTFPSMELTNKIASGRTVSEEDIDELLATQKDDKYAFSILALLYPNLDYKNNNFDKDHLHAEDLYDSLPQALKDKYPFKVYNSIINLQMLDLNENRSKGKKPLDQWVDESTTSATRDSFLKNHLIPNVDLSLSNLEEFMTERTKLLKTELKNILS